MREEPTNIGIDASRAVSATRTGTEGYSHHLIRALLALESGHEFRLYFNQPPVDNPFVGARVTYRVIPFPRLWTHLRLSLELWRSAPDVLFVPAHVVPVVHPPGSVVTIHDVGYLFYRAAYRRTRWLYLYLSTIFSTRVARRVIADSSATRDDLIGHLGIPPSKIDVVHLGVDSTFRPRSAAEIAPVVERYGLPPRYLLALSTIHPRKNLANVLRALALARQSAPVDLVVVGQAGHRAAEFRRLATSLRLDDRVRWLGYLPQDDLPALVAGATALVYPSLYEGFGLPVLEAMAAGTPVVTSTTSSLPEVAGDAAMLVDPTSPAAIADAIARVVADSALADDLRQRGLRRASTFTWERAARETLVALERAGAPL